MKTPIRLAALSAVLALLTPMLRAQVPQILNYQGRVGVGTPPVNFDGSGFFKFALVNATGTTIYWSNSADIAPADGVPDSAVTLPVTKGLYSVLLGDTGMTAIPASVFANPDVRLRVWFNDGTNGVQLLTPDQRIVAVGYAMVAGTVSDGAITSAKLATGAVGATQLASGLTLSCTTTGTFSGPLAGNATSATSAASATTATTAGTATNFSGSLAGDVTGTQGATSIAAATMTGKALTGFASTTGTITATDTILSGLNKLNGNVALKAPLASPTFAGTVTAATTNLSGTLTLPAGTITLAPLRLQTGVNLTTPLFGAVEFNGTNLFLTNNSVTPTRKTIAFTDSLISAAQIPAGLIDATKLADGTITGNELASGLTLGGTTVGTFSGSGAALTSLNATNISTGTLADARLSTAVVLLTATQTLTNTTITGSFTGPLAGNVSGSAASFTGILAGHVTGTQGATVVATVGGVTAANVALGANSANAATNLNTAGAIVERDASGNFAAGTITAAGALRVGAATASFPLSLADTLGDKIGLSGQTGAHFGLGVQTNLLQIHTPASTSAAFTETARIKGTGEFIAKVVTITGGSDVAEPYEVAGVGDVKPLPGMVVAIRTERVGEMRVTSAAYDRTVAGILSGANGIAPGITLRQTGTISDGALPVASIGRVWCWCAADANGPIEAGDLLTTSDTPGHGMRATDRERRDGAVIGKAMSPLPFRPGTGLRPRLSQVATARRPIDENSKPSLCRCTLRLCAAPRRSRRAGRDLLHRDHGQ